MNKLNESYERFVRFVTGDGLLSCPSATFRSICSRLHVSPASLDELLLAETGLDGCSIVAACKAMQKHAGGIAL